MKLVKEEVKSEKVVVGTPEIPVFETLDEAFQHLAGGNVDEGKKIALGLINTQNGTNIKNEIRARYNQKPSKAALTTEAMEAFGKLSIEEMQKISGDPSGVKIWIEGYITQKQSEWETKRAAMVQPSEDDKKDGE